MIDQRLLESFLRLNKVDTSAPATEVEKILVQARWPADQIKEALAFRSGGASAQSAVARDNLAFRPDMDWSTSRLSSLLGIDVVIDPKSFRASLSHNEQVKRLGKRFVFGLSIGLIALTIATGIGIGLMYFFEIGPFYHTTAEII